MNIMRLMKQKCFKIITNSQRAKLRKYLVNIGQQIQAMFYVLHSVGYSRAQEIVIA